MGWSDLALFAPSDGTPRLWGRAVPGILAEVCRALGSRVWPSVAVVMIPLVATTNEGIEEDQKEEDYRECLVENQGDEGLLSPEDWCENLNPDGSGSDGGS